MADQTNHYGFFLHNPAGTLGPGQFGHNMLARQIDDALYVEETERIDADAVERASRIQADNALDNRCDGLASRVTAIEQWIARHNLLWPEGADVNAD